MTDLDHSKKLNIYAKMLIESNFLNRSGLIFVKSMRMGSGFSVTSQTFFWNSQNGRDIFSRHALSKYDCHVVKYNSTPRVDGALAVNGLAIEFVVPC